MLTSRATAAIERAAGADTTPAHHMGVDLGRLDVLVAHQLLHGANIVAVIQQVGRKGVPQGGYIK